MRALRRAALIPKAGRWICHNCLTIQERRNPNCKPATRSTRTPELLTLNGVKAQSSREANGVACYSTAEQSKVLGSARDNQNIKTRPKGKQRPVILAVFIGTLLVFTFSDTARHGYEASRRSLRVAGALVLNVRE